MLKDTKNILLIILAIIVAILLLRIGCNSNKIEEPDLGPKIDSITTHDTIWSKDTIISFKSIVHPKWDTIYKIDTLNIEIDPLDLFMTREYNDSLVDSNQTVYTHIRTFGMLDSLNVKYKLKIPIEINNTTTITIEKPITKAPKFAVYTGIELGGNKNTFDISPFINLNVKNNNVYYRYGVLNQTHNVGVGIKLFKSKK